jgi:hypothetical protein
MIFGDGVWQHLGDVAVIVAWGVAGVIVSIRRFRWEPRER